MLDSTNDQCRAHHKNHNSCTASIVNPFLKEESDSFFLFVGCSLKIIHVGTVNLAIRQKVLANFLQKGVSFDCRAVTN